MVNILPHINIYYNVQLIVWALITVGASAGQFGDQVEQFRASAVQLDRLRAYEFNRYLVEDSFCPDRTPVNNTDCFGREHCNYCEYQRCWSRDDAAFLDESECDTNNPDVDVCLDLESVNPLPSCPSGIQVEWNATLTHQIKQDETFYINSTLDFGNYVPQYAPCGNNIVSSPGVGLITEAMVRACTLQGNNWWCRNIIPAYQPSIMATSDSICSNTTDFAFKFDFNQSNPFFPNEWTIFVQYTFFTNSSSNGLTKWRIARGSTFLVQGTELTVRPFVYNSLYALAAFTMAVPVIYACIITYFKSEPVIKAAHYQMTMLTLFGALLASIATLTWIPVPLSDAKCQARQWLLPFAFDFLFIPLYLKTWRVKRLFNNKLKRVQIKNGYLLKVFGTVLCVEIVYNLLWSLIPSAKLKAKPKSFTTAALNPNTFEMMCLSESESAQWAFTMITLILHSIPLIFLTGLAHRIRLSFKNSSILRKYDEFDESLFIMLALVDILVVSLFVVIFQFVIDANPNTVTIMRCSGIVWVAFFTITILYLPKFYTVFTDKGTDQEADQTGGNVHRASRSNGFGYDDGNVNGTTTTDTAATTVNIPETGVTMVNLSVEQT